MFGNPWFWVFDLLLCYHLHWLSSNSMDKCHCNGIGWKIIGEVSN